MSPFKKLTLAVAAFAMSAAALADTHAIVVGINEYPDPTDATGNPLKDENGNPVSSKLRGAVNDAKGIQKLLQDKYEVDADNITVLLDKDATGDKLVAAFQKVFKAIGPDDQFVFYFSGHGTRVKDAESKDADGQSSAIVLVDYQLVRGKLFGDMARQLANGGVDSTFIFDSCFAGGMSRDVNIYGFRNARKKQLDLNRPISGRLEGNLKGLQAKSANEKGQYAFLFASQPDITSIDLPDSPDGKFPAHGLFTMSVLAVLEEEPKVASRELIEAIAAFFEETFKGQDIKQRPTNEYSSADRARKPVVITG